jgi:LPS-assembly lipoprotein
MMKRVLIPVAGLLLLQGCGFEPLYGNTGGMGTGVSSTLQAIYVEPISERIGYDLRNDLLDRLDGTSNANTARYRLKLAITELEEPVVFQPNTSITRYNYTLTAHYDLVARDVSQPLKSGDVTAFAAYNVAAAPYLYSTVAAQRDAKNRAANDIAERIRIELAVYLRQVAQDTR